MVASTLGMNPSWLKSPESSDPPHTLHFDDITAQEAVHVTSQGEKGPIIRISL